MKVALCLYGQPRSYKKVLHKWKHVIQELNCDVFIHTWSGIDRAKNNIDINELISDFSPTEIKVSKPHKFMSLVNGSPKYENQSYHSMNQAFSISESLELLNSHIDSFKLNYDVVIRSRFDIDLLDIDSFIEFIKNDVNTEYLYVANNHWKGSPIFDDNIMVGSESLMYLGSVGYFNYTIQYINKNNMIPGGEQNLYRWIESIDLGKSINRVDNLNFNLVPMNTTEMILNQNEE